MFVELGKRYLQFLAMGGGGSSVENINVPGGTSSFVRIIVLASMPAA